MLKRLRAAARPPLRFGLSRLSLVPVTALPLPVLLPKPLPVLTLNNTCAVLCCPVLWWMQEHIAWMRDNDIVQRLLRTGLHHKQYMNEVRCLACVVGRPCCMYFCVCAVDDAPSWRLHACQVERQAPARTSCACRSFMLLSCAGYDALRLSLTAGAFPLAAVGRSRASW